MNQHSDAVCEMRYARLLVTHGMNVRPGQFVQIDVERHAEDLALIVAECAYEAGARHVSVQWHDPHLKYARLTKGPVDDRFLFFPYEQARSEHIVDAQGCYLSLRTNSAPDLFRKIPALSVDYDNAVLRMRRRYLAEGVEKGAVSWCVAYPPSPRAARKAYPELGAGDALVAFRRAIYRMTFADKHDCMQLWSSYDDQLHRRRARLTALGIAEVRVEGPGTDLVIGLSEKAVWQGGSKKTAAGKRFTANVPSFEVFTRPDWRLVNGHVTITRPVNVGGVVVEDLLLTFENGEVVDVNCRHNADAYRALLASDDGAKRLGEIGLVGTDSPVAQENRIFYETLYDENAACHIATGSGYASCIQGGWGMTTEQLASCGRNNSRTHQDVMISDARTRVTAATHAGEETVLIENGAWTGNFI